MAPIWTLPALDLARRIAARELSCVEVIDAHLARIAEVTPALNAVVRVLEADARAAALAADARAAAGEPLGPLHGVPFTVKENIDVAGQATTWGVRPLAEAVVPMDAPVVKRMRAAGAIVVGRTNLSDMALRVHTDSSLHGLTKNPWNPARTSGGSSGGDAAALATGMTAIGLGNDIGGSLRNPANACGIASIRPTQGRVRDAGFVPAEDRTMAVQLMNMQGPMARKVADVRAALKVLMGAHPRDACVGGCAVRECTGAPADPCRSRRRAAGRPDRSRHRYHRAPRRGCACRRRLRDRRCLPAAIRGGDRNLGAFSDRRFRPGTTATARHDGRRRPHLSRDRQGRGSAAGGCGGVFGTPHPARQHRPSLVTVFAETPLVLTPTWTQHPFAVGHDVASPQASGEVMQMMRPVVHANLLGLPSACVPAGRDAAIGLPTGVLLTGARFRDDLCLAAAEVVEARLGLATPIDPAGH